MRKYFSKMLGMMMILMLIPGLYIFVNSSARAATNPVLKDGSLRIAERDLSLAVKESRPLTVMLIDKEGNQTILTNGVRFRSLKPSIAAVTADGTVRGRRIGKVKIKASYQGLTAYTVIHVISAPEITNAAVPSGNGGQVVVSPTGEADYRTITEAIRSVGPGGTVYVKPGVYSETLVINKEVNIIGGSDPQEVLIQVKNSNCITMKATQALMRGLSLDCTAGERGHAVSIISGALTLEDCSIRVHQDTAAAPANTGKDANQKGGSADAHSCIAVWGDRSQLIARRCGVRSDGSDCIGITADNHGRITVEDCEISGNYGLRIDNGSDAILRRCKVLDCSNGLIDIAGHSQCVMEDSEIDGKGFKLNGVSSDNSGTKMSRCKVTNCSTGICGATVIEDSEVTLCATGIDGKNGVTVRRCTIRDCTTGVRGWSLVEDSSLDKNSEYGIMLDDGTKSTVRRCRLSENGVNAIKAANNAFCLIAKCDFRNQANPLHEEGGGRIVNADFSEKYQGFIETKYFLIENGVYTFNGGKTRLFFKQAYDAVFPADFTAQVQAMWDNGKTDSGFGLIFRKVDDLNFYVFAIAGDGHCYLGRIIDNKWKALVNWQKTDLIHPGFNFLKVTCKGQTITCYLNDQTAIVYEDPEWSPVDAKTGVGVAGGVQCSFDNFLAY